MSLHSMLRAGTYLFTLVALWPLPSFSQSTQDKPVKTVVAAAPISVQGNEQNQLIRILSSGALPTNEVVGVIRHGVFCADPKDVYFSKGFGELAMRDYFNVLKRELQMAGHRHQEDGLFRTGTVDVEPAEYELTGALVDVQIKTCGDANRGEGAIWLKFRWEMLSPRERRIVFKVETEGTGQTSGEKKPYPELFRQALTGSVRNLLALPGFVENTTRKAVARNTATGLPVLSIAKHSSSEQAIGENMALLQSAVVTIYSGNGSGTGFYINKEGWILTNHHVVGDAKFVKVKLAGGKDLVGEVVRSAVKRDVALIKTEAVALMPMDVGRGINAGDDVFVLGSPLGETLAHTVTKGVLSSSREVDGQRWLQSDVRVLPGSSGGPMVGRNGAVVGIASRGLANGSAGINFFVPIADALGALRIEATP